MQHQNLEEGFIINWNRGYGSWRHRTEAEGV